MSSSPPPADPARPELLRHAFSLWIVVALLGLVIVLVFLTLIAGRHRRRMRAGRARRRPMVKDAWVEAGRRMPTPPSDDPDHEAGDKAGGGGDKPKDGGPRGFRPQNPSEYQS